MTLKFVFVQRLLGNFITVRTEASSVGHRSIKSRLAGSARPGFLKRISDLGRGLSAWKRSSGPSLVLPRFQSSSVPGKAYGRGYGMGAEVVLLGLVRLAILAGGAVLIGYEIYLWFDLNALFKQAPYEYGFFKRVLVNLVVASAILKFVGKAATLFFDIKNKDEDEEEEKPDPEESIQTYAIVGGAIALISSTFILYQNWGTIGSSFSYALNIFTAWHMHQMLGGILAIRLVCHIISKIVGWETKYEYPTLILHAIVATFIAPIAEEVIFRYVYFNLSRWLWVSFFDLSRPFNYVLPFFNVSVGWNLPVGIFIAMVANADVFYKVHVNEKRLHHWLGGIATSYAYYTTGNLVVPITLHFVWNGLVSIFILILHAIMPLKVSYFGFVKRTASQPTPPPAKRLIFQAA